MRIVSDKVKQLLTQGYAETADIVDITVPSSEINPEGIILRLASRDGLFVGSNEYKNHLRSLGTLKMSLGSSPDTASFSIENVSLTFSSLVSETSNYIEGSTAVISKVFILPNGDQEVVPLFEGVLNGLRFNQEAISVNLVSHMSLKTSQVARRPITQRCIWQFKSSQCGWVKGLGGDDSLDETSDKFKFCDRGWDTPNGCLAHGNIHRYGGIPQFTGFTSIDGGSGYENNQAANWGLGPGGGWCVSPESYVLVDFNGPVWRLAVHLEEGDTLYSVDKFGKIVKTKLAKVTDGTSTSMYTITTRNGYKLTCSPSHPVITETSDTKGVPASSLRPGNAVLVYDYDSNSVLQDEVADIEIFAKDSMVIMLSIDEETHTYIAGDLKTGGIVSHNAKQVAMTRTGYSNSNVWRAV